MDGEEQTDYHYYIKEEPKEPKPADTQPTGISLPFWLNDEHDQKFLYMNEQELRAIVTIWANGLRNPYKGFLELRASVKADK
jgi:hypothetical protein